MEKIKNFRELASGQENRDGQPIKKDKIFRSGELSKATKEDIDKLIHLGIKSIYDLRSLYEQESQINHPALKIYGFNVSQSTSRKRMDKEFLMNLANSDVDEFMVSLYRDYLAFSPVLKPLFQQIIRERKPFLFHCSAGKDRTGIVGALLMSLLDFDQESIYQEYVIIDQRILIETMESQRIDGLSEEIIQKIKPLSGVKESYIKAFYKAILDKYETMDQYFNDFLELDERDIQSFKKYMLET